MKDQLSIYKLWAPDDAVWARWAKPVLFQSPVSGPVSLPESPGPDWLTMPDRKMAVIADLPGAESVAEGLALARIGYRPVPLYNGVNGPEGASIVKTGALAAALCAGADVLEALRLRADAPPAFLLDANRMNGVGSRPGQYDNRWCVFPQDMPSAAFLREQGIDKVAVRSRTGQVASDLSHILCRYQEQGIKVLVCDEEGRLKLTTVKRPSRFKGLSYRFGVILGLSRNAAGGFGGVVPEPTQSGTGRRYYGFG